MGFEVMLERQLLGKASSLLPFFRDDTVTDILINGTQSLYVEREGKLTAESNPFPDRESLADLIERLLLPLGRRVDATQPYLDGYLLDGSRFHIILPPLAPQAAHISIRKFRRERVALESFGSSEKVEWLRREFRERRNLLIVGGTGAGKTTLLGRLLDEASPGERILCLEESRELQTSHPHTLYLEARAMTPEGKGEVTLRALLRNALRMRPDRIVVGEVRGAEAFDLLLALNTGHRGGLGTLHANSALDGLRRLETLAILAGYLIPLKTVREWIGANIHGVVFVERSGSQREIREAIVVNGLEGENYRITPRFR
jgi:pilus assembly protein CpaF